MNPDDLMEAIEQAAVLAEQGHARQAIEAYINRAVVSITSDARCYLATSSSGIPEPEHSRLEMWQLQNRDRLSLQIGEVTRILLRKELLGE